MKIRVLAFGLACAASLCAQHRMSWQEACFKNPGAPYCPGHDFAVKPAKGGANSNGTSAGMPPSTPSIDAGGIDWRFADPAADALVVMKGSKLIGQLGLPPADVQNLSRALSAVNELAVSVHEDRIVLQVSGRSPDAVLPAPEPGWKAVSLTGNALLIGPVDAVDQALQRIATASPLGELAQKASERPADIEFWAAGPEAKVFSATAEGGTEVPAWLSALGGTLVKSARYLPVRDTATTVHTKPVIYGLDDGARETK